MYRVCRTKVAESGAVTLSSLWLCGAMELPLLRTCPLSGICPIASGQTTTYVSSECTTAAFFARQKRSIEATGYRISKPSSARVQRGRNRMAHVR
jgi:hypothetical protein